MLKRYFQSHKHLPGIPPASWVESNGFSIGMLQRSLLKTIEELTLYVLDADRELKEIETKLSQKKDWQNEKKSLIELLNH
jgi:hypothetical protein